MFEHITYEMVFSVALIIIGILLIVTTWSLRRMSDSAHINTVKENLWRAVLRIETTIQND